MNDYFCVMPFFGAEISPVIGRVSPCCFLKRNSDIKKIRNEMLQKKRPMECSTCWQLEDKGIKSDRQYKNESFDYYTNKDITTIEQDCLQGNYSEQIVKLYTSTLCNSTCVTCRPEASSAWAALTKSKSKSLTLSDTLLHQIKYKDLKMLSFVGGEPLYEKKNFEILDNLAQSGNTDCFISMVTNGSVSLSDSQIKTITQFKNLNLCLSIDGIESKFEYVRYPLKWKKLLENISMFRYFGVQLSVSYTISNLNILYYNETIDWFKSQGLAFNHNVVNDPVWYAVNSLPVSIKSKLPQESQYLLRPHELQDDHNFALFVKNIEHQDSLKNISMVDYMPEMHRLIKQNV